MTQQLPTTSQDAPGENASTISIPGMISYTGFVGSHQGSVKFIEFYMIVDGWHLHPDWRKKVEEDFKTIRTRFGASYIRFLVMPSIRCWENKDIPLGRQDLPYDELGITFPKPSMTVQGRQEMENFRALIDLAWKQGLGTMLVFMMPQNKGLRDMNGQCMPMPPCGMLGTCDPEICSHAPEISSYFPYSYRDPDTIDTPNNTIYIPVQNPTTQGYYSLAENMISFLDDFFEYVVKPEVSDVDPSKDKIKFIDLWGDFGGTQFDFSTYNAESATLCTHPRVDPCTANAAMRKWYRYLWPHFTNHYRFVAPSKKTIEIVASSPNLVSQQKNPLCGICNISSISGITGSPNPHGDPWEICDEGVTTGIPGEIEWLKRFNLSNGFQQPGVISITGYSHYYGWQQTYPGNTPIDRTRAAYTDLILQAQEKAGATPLLVEEMGASHSIYEDEACKSPPFASVFGDCKEGEIILDGMFSAIQKVSPTTVVGIWNYRDHEEPYFGLFRWDGQITNGAKVLPRYWLPPK